MDLTLGAAALAGLISFLSPCVLPVVPAYLGQLGVVAVAGLDRRQMGMAMGATALAGASAATSGSASVPIPATVTPPAPSSRPSWGASRGWRAMPSAIAFVLGFGVIFTVLGVTAYVAVGPLRDNLPFIRQLGGVLLIVLGLNLMGVLRLSTFARSWRPLDRFVGRRPGAERHGVVGGFTLGAIFAVGWTPCIGPTLGAILTLAAIGTGPQVVALLIAYSAGLGIPFLLLALAVDRAPGITAPLVRHGRTIEIVGGALVVVLGFAILFDWLGFFASQLRFLWPSV